MTSRQDHKIYEACDADNNYKRGNSNNSGDQASDDDNYSSVDVLRNRETRRSAAWRQLELQIFSLTRVFVRSRFDEVSHRLNVPVCHRLRVRQLLREAEWNANLRCSQVRVWGDNRPTGVVDSFAHHVFAKETFLFFKYLRQKHHNKKISSGDLFSRDSYRLA